MKNTDASNPFLLSRRIRKYYDFIEEADDALDSGQLLAERINHRREASTRPEQSVRAGQIEAIGLIDKIFHYLSDNFHQTDDQKKAPGLTEELEEKLGSDSLSQSQDILLIAYPAWISVRISRWVQTVLKEHPRRRELRS